MKYVFASALFAVIYLAGLSTWMIFSAEAWVLLPTLPLLYTISIFMAGSLYKEWKWL